MIEVVIEILVSSLQVIDDSFVVFIVFVLNVQRIVIVVIENVQIVGFENVIKD